MGGNRGGTLAASVIEGADREHTGSDGVGENGLRKGFLSGPEVSQFNMAVGWTPTSPSFVTGLWDFW